LRFQGIGLPEIGLPEIGLAALGLWTPELLVLFRRLTLGEALIGKEGTGRAGSEFGEPSPSGPSESNRFFSVGEFAEPTLCRDGEALFLRKASRIVGGEAPTRPSLRPRDCLNEGVSRESIVAVSNAARLVRGEVPRDEAALEPANRTGLEGMKFETGHSRFCSPTWANSVSSCCASQMRLSNSSSESELRSSLKSRHSGSGSRGGSEGRERNLLLLGVPGSSMDI